MSGAATLPVVSLRESGIEGTAGRKWMGKGWQRAGHGLTFVCRRRVSQIRGQGFRLLCQPGIKPCSVRTYFLFFSFSRPRNFYVRFEYTMCIPLYNTFLDSFRDRGTKREFERKKRFELDKVKKKKENIFLLLFSIPLP